MRPSHRIRLRLFLGLVTLAVVAVGALAAFVLLVPAAKLDSDPQMLARLKLAPAGVSLESVHVSAPDGSPIKAAVRGGRVVPLEKLLPGEPLSVRITVRRAGWAAWIGGKTKVLTLSVTTPTARVTTDLLRPASGDIVRLQLDSPVEIVRTTGGAAGGQNLTFAAPHNAISLNIRALGATKIGTVARAGRRPQLGDPLRPGEGELVPGGHDTAGARLTSGGRRGRARPSRSA